MAGHHHAHWCDGSDHHAGTYTAQQRADLDRVLAFNRQMATAIEECHDISSVEEYLDPDPLRYMWVDEGQGQIGPTLDTAEKVLKQWDEIKATEKPARERTLDGIPAGPALARAQKVGVRLRVRDRASAQGRSQRGDAQARKAKHSSAHVVDH